MILSKETACAAPGGRRNAGTDSTAQASEAHDDKIARFSWRSSVSSSTTSSGDLKCLAGDSSRSSARSDVSGAREGMIGESVCRFIVVLRLPKAPLCGFDFISPACGEVWDYFVRPVGKFKREMHGCDPTSRMFSWH
jgi:hypothetical protein